MDLCPNPKLSSPLLKPLHDYACSVQSLSRVWLFVILWTAASQASLSITNSWSLLKFISNPSVMQSNHLILCHPLLLLPSIFPSIRVFSNESVLCITYHSLKLPQFLLSGETLLWEQSLVFLLLSVSNKPFSQPWAWLCLLAWHPWRDKHETGGKGAGHNL